ncbi:MAG: phosphoribosylamine--glycine ligase [Patescibacteria group bacterium]
MSKNVFVIGSGGREHALAWKIAQSLSVERVFVAPGNAGTAREPKIENVAIKATDLEGLLAWAKEHKPDLIVVGPDDPLALGIVDLFQKEGFRIFGPTKAAARLEWSKAFTKEFLKRHSIPTAAYEVFNDAGKAAAYIRARGAPIVVKADGLAAGKGVVVARTIDEAIHFTDECLSGGRFGESGTRVVIEEFMEGEEASFTALVDGEHFLAFPSAQDHKRVFDGDQGPNTGGMGTYSPAPIVTSEVERRIINEIIQPTIMGMREAKAPFTGFLYCGLMIKDGEPKVVEFNARFGDPETQPILVRLKSDLVELIEAALDGKLDTAHMEIDERAALCVVMTSGGYPGEYATGEEIAGIQEAESVGDIKVFHAGTKEADGKLLTSGGRVLGVTALGPNIAAAQKKTYEAVAKIHFNNAHFRNDIGWRAV